MKAAPAARLEGVVPTGTQLPADQMMRAAAQLTTSRELRHFMRLWVEIVAAAARSEAPFVAISTALLDGFLAWVRKHLALAPGEDADAQAALVVAMIDGLALIDICRADDLVVRAAGQL
jgi:hypothetical protein